MVLKPPLNVLLMVLHGRAGGRCWGLPTATTLRKYHATPARWWRGAGTSEASRDGEDNPRATIALWVHRKARVYASSSPPPFTSICRERDQANTTAGLIFFICGVCLLFLVT